VGTRKNERMKLRNQIMPHSSQQIVFNVDDLLTTLEPLIRRIIREELADFALENIVYLEPNTPLYNDMQDIKNRSTQGKVKLYSHEEVWDN